MKHAEKIKTEATITFISGQVIAVPIDMLMPDPDQPRREFAQEKLAEFAADIKSRGIESPLIVRSDYVIKHGERRWRAAKLAGLDTVPCLLAAPASDDNPILQRELDQLTHNHHQEPLTPMEWARLLKRLVEVHKITVGQVPEMLEQRGIKMSRPYISNLMRLVELPDWAQEMINSGRLTAAHGKYLLPALRSEKVLKHIRAALAVPIDLWNGIKTVEELEEVVADAFQEHHVSLDDQPGDGPPLFETCDRGECPCFFKLSDARYCLNDAEFKRNQKTAIAPGKVKTPADKKAADPPKPKKIEPAKNGIVNLDKLHWADYKRLDSADFDIAVCTGCEYNKIAARGADKKTARATCFNVPEFEKKQREFQKSKGRRARAADYFDVWVTEQLLKRLTGNYDLQFQIICYMALGMPGSYSGSLDDERLQAEEDNDLGNLPALLARGKDAELPTEQIAAAGVRAFDRENLYHLARYVGVELLPTTYKIDAAYIDLFKKADMAALVGAYPALAKREDWKKAEKGKYFDMKAFCLSPDVVAAIGVPPELAHLYAKTEISVSRETDDDPDADGEVDP